MLGRSLQKNRGPCINRQHSVKSLSLQIHTLVPAAAAITKCLHWHWTRCPMPAACTATQKAVQQAIPGKPLPCPAAQCLHSFDHDSLTEPRQNFAAYQWVH